MSAIGERIKQMREKRRWSQLMLSEKAGINNSVLSRIESGKRPVEDSLLMKFAEILECSSDYLLGRSDEPTLTEHQYNEALKHYGDLIELIESMPEEKREFYLQRIRDFAKGLKDST